MSIVRRFVVPLGTTACLALALGPACSTGTRGEAAQREMESVMQAAALAADGGAGSGGSGSGSGAGSGSGSGSFCSQFTACVSDSDCVGNADGSTCIACPVCGHHCWGGGGGGPDSGPDGTTDASQDASDASDAADVSDASDGGGECDACTPPPALPPYSLQKGDAVKLSLKDVLPGGISTSFGDILDISVDANWYLQAKYESAGVCAETGMAKAGGKLGGCGSFMGNSRCAAVGFKGGGSGTLCKTPQCPPGGCQEVCTDPSGINLSGDLNAGVAVGTQFKKKALGGEISLKGMVGLGGIANCGFKNGEASCGCGNAGTFLKLLTGPNAGLSLQGALSYKLFNQTVFQVSTDVKGCVGGQLGSQLNCDGSSQIIADKGYYAGWNLGNVYIPPGMPVRVTPMGTQFQVCVGGGWFERCWTFDYALIKGGDSKWCPASL